MRVFILAAALSSSTVWSRFLWSDVEAVPDASEGLSLEELRAFYREQHQQPHQQGRTTHHTGSSARSEPGTPHLSTQARSEPDGEARSEPPSFLGSPLRWLSDQFSGKNETNQA